MILYSNHFIGPGYDFGTGSSKVVSQISCFADLVSAALDCAPGDGDLIGGGSAYGDASRDFFLLGATFEKNC